MGPATRRGAASIFLLLLALFAGGALSVPFVYESQTLWYKVGFDKTLLRCGQLAGLAAAVSIFVQMLLGVRGRLLEEIFGVIRLTRWHRINGLVIASFGILHVSLVLLVEEMRTFLALKSWPELIGASLLLIILANVIFSLFRQQIGMNYAHWRLMHRLLAYFSPMLLAIHVLFVSDSFAQDMPKVGLFSTLAALAAAILKIKRLVPQRG